MIAHPIAFGIAVFFALAVLAPHKEPIPSNVFVLICMVISSVSATISVWSF
jgi:hypothetical protein